MAAFNDYCAVCEKLLDGLDIYCSEECKHLDEAFRDDAEPTIDPLLKSPLLYAQSGIDHEDMDDLELPASDSLQVPRTMGRLRNLCPIQEVCNDEKAAAQNYRLWLQYNST
ncbi:hypothetical protein AO441_000851 [Nakaseomyces glabratus]|uniref:Uncharacterized protein n=1 Tax=Candida glabrata TaxID=5478 RepID=A0A0W0C6U7_CANGB|nr:hypothetical protein J7298_01087 [Nakaseomyces glabratus]KAH7605454.1 hypothetical protein J7295_01088 [Nakaseomyces glabratus]KAH7614459.1 hypothetical protein J7292_01068 [Nakaseomyces glabratus]KAI8389058.1 hypothetical protein J6894_01083 [Nakaseomyces glabratus]KAJ9570977.1 hypothetical protein LTX96_0002443 [Nakaseomyces glabratus]